MKSHLLLIRTIMPDSTPSPRPSLIADLVDSVLKVPGMRVASVEVVEISAAETITRRIRKTGSEATSAPSPVLVVPQCKQCQVATSRLDYRGLCSGCVAKDELSRLQHPDRTNE